MDKQAFLEIRNQLDFTRKPSRLWLHFAQDGILIGGVTLCLARPSLATYGLAQALVAAFFFRAFSLMHDAVHGALHGRESVNDWIGVIFGGLCFLPYTTWKAMHLDHHFWAGNVDKDPVMKMVREFPKKSAAHKRWKAAIWKSWIPYIAFLQEVVFWSVSVSFISGGRIQPEKRIELLLSVAAPVVFAGSLVVVGNALGSALYFLPAFIAYLVLIEVINFPHHLRLRRLSGERSLPLWNQYKVSRTCVYSSWFSRLVLLNFNYHAEHHMFPALPWHELPRAQKLVRERLRAEDYNFCIGHEWIVENRQKDLAEVFAPTGSLDDEITTRKAA